VGGFLRAAAGIAGVCRDSCADTCAACRLRRKAGVGLRFVDMRGSLGLRAAEEPGVHRPDTFPEQVPVGTLQVVQPKDVLQLLPPRASVPEEQE